MKKPIRVTAANSLHADIAAYAAAYFLSRGERIGSAELRGFASELMGSISGSCLDQGAKVIGHIKAYIECKTGFLHSHTVGEPGDVVVEGSSGGPVDSFKLVVNTVVYGMNTEAAKAATESAVDGLLVKYGFARGPEE